MSILPLPPRPRVLVVDDDEQLSRFIAEVLTDAKYEVTALTSAKEAIERLEHEEWDLIVTDLRMPDVSGFELIEWARQYDPRIAVLAITAYGSIETAVQAVRRGAWDYVTKPFEPAGILLAVDKCLRERAMRLELARLRTDADERFGWDEIVAQSTVMKEIVALAKRISDSPSTVLITGPSGVGKEVLARAIHQSSRRRARPFMAVNCAAIPDQLLESELFGHRRGAFTGAVADKVGLFQEASGGTLFLDEIGDLPLALQVKLLRVLQEREIRPVGATRSEAIDVRLIAATHHDLRKSMEEKSFREDLFYRLCVLEIIIPRLMDRPDDIIPLAEHFLAVSNARLHRNVRGLSGAARRMLTGYGWPGNVRELQNVIERAVNLCDTDLITPDVLPEALHRPREENFLDKAAEQGMTVGQLETAYARRVLTHAGGNKKRAARLLGIDRRTLRRWLGEREDDRDDDGSEGSDTGSPEDPVGQE